MKKNILVVDDSALMRRVICDIINSDETFQAIDTCRDINNQNIFFHFFILSLLFC